LKKIRTIAVSGKGGTGKTTLSSLLIRNLMNMDLKPVLAIDADPNSNLGDALGMEVTKSIGLAREEFFGDRMKVPAGMPKNAFLEIKFNEVINEGKGLDLLVMGRPEGSGCYCYINNILRHFIETLSSNYNMVVIDNEAGMEHLSRRTTRSIDALILASDYSLKGIRTVIRIRDLVRELQLAVGDIYVVVGRAPGPVPEEFSAILKENGLSLNGVIPLDPAVAELDLKGAPMTELPDDSPAFVASRSLLNQVLNGSS
jgi:CO dehydrogenase maturation factor